MASVTFLEDDTCAPQEKGKESVAKTLMSSAQRKKLADISNLQQDQAKQLMKSEETTQQQQNTILSSKEYVEKLQKENMTLIKAVAHRNNIIERSGVEIQKLRVNLRSVQEKNLQFAQANSQMLAVHSIFLCFDCEIIRNYMINVCLTLFFFLFFVFFSSQELNINRDRLKVLQHELSCKNALLNARKMQLEETDMNQKDTKKKQTSKITPSGDSTVKPIPVNEKTSNSRRRVSGLVDANGICEETCQTEDDFEKEIDSLVANQMVDDVVNKKFGLDASNPVKDSVPRKRQCARRQSTRFHVQETEQAAETVDAKDIKEPARLPLKRRSARFRPEEAEPCKSLHDREEVRETIKKRRVSLRQQSARLDLQEPEVTETLNADDAGCLVIEESVKSRSIAVEEPAESRPDTKEATVKRRVSMRRQSAKTTSQIATEPDGAIKEIATPLSKNIVQECDPGPSSEDHEPVESRQEAKEKKAKRRVSVRRQSAKTKSQTLTETDEAIKGIVTSFCKNIVQDCDPVPSSKCHNKEPKNKPKADETEETVRRTSVGRPSRHAAEKVQSYREVSLKVKMRRH